MSKALAVQVLQEFLNVGGEEICICPGSRNAPFVSLAAAHANIKTYYFYEERSAAFFALGRSRRTGRPVAVVTTSGTAAVELFPAISEAYYSGVPLVAITADRPRCYRGTNAPQSCEQEGLYGQYARWSVDLEGTERFDLSSWEQKGPAHVNVCLAEPLKCAFQGNELSLASAKRKKASSPLPDMASLTDFLLHVDNPFVIVGGVQEDDREEVRRFLLRLNRPAYVESLSGLREDPTLAHLRICQSTGLWKKAEAAGYPIDGVLRIGRVPTVRLWRDLEDMQDRVRVCSVSDVPFSGLSWGGVVCGPLKDLFDSYSIPSSLSSASFGPWMRIDASYQERLEVLFKDEPLAEPSLVRALAEKIPSSSVVYLGNSQPIREWDLAAPYHPRGLDVAATRGLNGIDGQASTFFGLAQKHGSNWALLGDLTALYDMSGFWITEQLRGLSFHVVVINNGGGKIFSRMYPEQQFLNLHSLNFKALADMWKLPYERWEEVPGEVPEKGKGVIEIVPDNAATKRFWEKEEEIARECGCDFRVFRDGERLEPVG